ncbi:tetratricopeptide repeat protein [Pendulispora albinea]|uniref:Peptidase MA-like domain-containing protein n=1 Tax=Pendulispora albinea TaxID=2741071 RepID=A0ABZ2M8A2_9BACT
MKTVQRSLLAAGAALTVLAVAGGAVRADGPNDHAARAQDLIMANDFDEARKELGRGRVDDPAIALERARLSLYEADCDGALVVLSSPDVAKTEQGAMLADIARGCARITAATVLDEDRDQGVWIRYQDENDRALTPLIVDTVVKARDALTRDLGATWPKPTRIVVVRDLLSLSAMTGLPYESAQTTGTVAVAKWGRVTLLSPRASMHGYAWRDTMAHELTHLAVTRSTIDRAPLWLQEGVAKREEVRWREPGPFDDRPSPDAIAARGIELKLDLPLDKLGPSIAMLPSADAALVAFSEVTSFVRYFATNTPPGTLERLFAALREGKEPDAALEVASSANLKQWDTRWRAYLASKPKETLPARLSLGKERPNLRDIRERVRLAELLVGRDHPAEALTELDRLQAPAGKPPAANGGPPVDDPSYRYLRGRVLLALGGEGRTKEAEVLFQEPKEVLASYGPWWAVRGVLARVRGDGSSAETSFAEAVATDPFDLEAACEVLDAPPSASTPASTGLSAPPVTSKDPNPLCQTARAWKVPALGQD